MSMSLRALIVEDSEIDLLLVLHELSRSGFDVDFVRVDTRDAMLAALDAHEWDVVISDYILPEFSGLEALALLKEKEIDLPFIVVSGKISDDTAVEAMKAGAHDYILKGNLARLVPAIEREIREARARQEYLRTQAELCQQREQELHIRLEAEEAKRLFYQRTIFAVTDGKLSLVSSDEIEAMMSCGEELPLASPDDLAALRGRVAEMAEEASMPEDRIDCLVTAVGEAATNAIKHADGGKACVWVNDEFVRVGIMDHGSGMDALLLPNATLKAGFSTKPSMGLGYSVILNSVDRVFLATDEHGTCVVMEQGIAGMQQCINLEALPDVW
ncbi:MAG: response regulator [Armatimonadota bacterium]|nr:response regulator [bacterium]